MKINKILSLIILSILLSTSFFSNITFAQGGNGGGTNGGSSSTGGDSSGSSSTGGDSTGGDYSGGGGVNTGGDSSGSDNTGNNNIGGDNSGSNNNHGQLGGFPSGGGDMVKNIYGEAIQLKARINNEEVVQANRIMNNINLNSGTGTFLQKKNKLQIHLDDLDKLNSNLISSGSLNYLKLRLEYRIGIYNEIGKIEGKMTNEESRSMNIFIRNFNLKYNNLNDSNLMAQYERLLGLSTSIQNKLGETNLNYSQRVKAQYILKYIELRMYEEIEELENN